jgi:hypothetical protein
MRRFALLSLLLLAAAPARGADPCPFVTGSDQPLVVELVVADTNATLVAGATFEVDHPEKKVGLEGEGIQVPKSTISGAPADAVASANDLGDRVRVVIARPGPLPANEPLLTLHFARCSDAPRVTAADFSCTVVTASDPSANKIGNGVGCKVTVP